MNLRRTILLIGGFGFLIAACSSSSTPAKDAAPTAGDGSTTATDTATTQTDAADVKAGADAAGPLTDTAGMAVDAATKADAAATQADTAGVAVDAATTDALVGNADTAASSCTTSDAGAACNALTNTAPAITIGTATGDVPAGTGGTIVSGTYFLTELKVYPGSAVPSGIQFMQTLVISGCVAQLVEGSTTHKTFSLTPVGTVPNWNMVCTSKAGDTPVIVSGYTATATTFAMYSATSKFHAVYTKQ